MAAALRGQKKGARRVLTNEERWERSFALLERFVAEHQRVPKTKDVYEGVKLGSWWNNQKQGAKTPGFPPDRLEMLRRVGSLGNTRDREWMRKYELLQKFVAEHQRVPKYEEVYEGVRLGVWWHKQKQRAKSKTCPQTKRDKLLEIGQLCK